MLRRVVFLSFLFAIASTAYAQNPLRLVNVTPCRLVDTRNSGPISGGTAKTYNLPQLASAGGAYGNCTGLNLSTAQAYSVNVTLVPNGNPVGYLTIWPAGEGQPGVSLMNSLDGRTKANAAIIPAGANGAVSVFVSNTSNVVIDIDAYFDSASDPSSLAFYPLTPCRVIDTRSNGGPLQGGVERDFPIPGTCGIPSNAQAYSFNFTLVPTQGAVGFLSVWPAGQSQPSVSTLNDLTGTTVANAAIVPAGTENETAVLASNPADVVIDVNGYFAPANSAPNPLSLYTLTPCRILDTRNNTGLFSGTFPVGIVGSQCGGSLAAAAFVLNATVVPQGPLGYLSLWPEGLSQPVVSTLNAVDGFITSNMAIVPAGTDGSIDTFASNDTQEILDISSYFAPITGVSVLTSTLPDAVLHNNYSYQLLGVAGVPPYTWQITSGALPPGMDPLNSNGTISGTPTSTGTSSFTVKATDAIGETATASLSLTVDATAGTLSITTPSLPTGTVNVPYNALLNANGGFTPYNWSLANGSNLLPGLSLNASTGLISGTPGSPGLSQFFVQVTDAQSNNFVQAFSIGINTGSTNGQLNGNYAFSFFGYGSDGRPFAVAGSIIANGNGTISGGESDQNKINGTVKHITIVGGSYSIGSNGLGTLNLTGSDGSNVQLLISIGDAEDMRVIGFNQGGPNPFWGAGVLREQNTSDFNSGALAGNWAFGLQGFDSASGPLSADGSYQLDGSGNISNGVEDINDFGTDDQVTFTGQATSSLDANGRSTSQIVIPGFGTLNQAVYIVSANELILVGIDGGGNVYVNSSLRQTGTMGNGILNSTMVGRWSRPANVLTQPVSQAGVFMLNPDGNGNMEIIENANTGGSISLNGTGQLTYQVEPSGRTVLSGSVLICYVIAQNEGFCINSGSSAPGALLGYAEPQASPGSYSDSSFFGEYLGGSLPQYVSGTFSEIDSYSAGGGAGNFTLTYTQSGPNGTQPNQMLNGSYSVAPDGGITIMGQHDNPLYFGYFVNSGKLDLMSLDDNPRVMIEVQSAAPRHP